MKMFLAESWQDRLEKIEVFNPYDGQTVDTEPKGFVDVEIALEVYIPGNSADAQALRI